MISVWWLLAIVPLGTFLGMVIMGCCAAAGRARLLDRQEQMRGELLKLLAFLLVFFPAEIEAAEDESAIDVAITLLAGQIELMRGDADD